GISGIATPEPMAGAEHVYHIYCVRVDGDRDAILKELNGRGIGAGIHYPIPVHLQPALAHRGWKRGDFPEAERAAESIISLPMYPELDMEQLSRIVETFEEVLRESRTEKEQD